MTGLAAVEEGGQGESGGGEGRSDGRMGDALHLQPDVVRFALNGCSGSRVDNDAGRCVSSRARWL